jgi:hypothetical protein
MLKAFSFAKKVLKSDGDRFGLSALSLSSLHTGGICLKGIEYFLSIEILIADEEASIKSSDLNAYFCGSLMNVRNSFLVLGFSLKIPLIQLVTVEDSGLCIPLVVIH